MVDQSLTVNNERQFWAVSVWHSEMTCTAEFWAKNFCMLAFYLFEHSVKALEQFCSSTIHPV